MPEKPVQRHYSKQAILDRWSKLETDQRIQMTPIDTKHKGSSYDQDSIRLTGSQEFIDSVLSRLTDIMDYDGNGSRLELLYTETVTRVKDEETGKLVAGQLTGAWAFYAKAKSRGSGVFGRPHGKKPKDEDRTAQEQLESEPSDDEPRPKEKANKLNAGLALKAKPKRKDIEISFAIGVKDDEDPDGWAWTEPCCGELPCDTYADQEMCESAIATLKKNKTMKGQKLQVVEVTNDNGDLTFREV